MKKQVVQACAIGIAVGIAISGATAVWMLRSHELLGSRALAAAPTETQHISPPLVQPGPKPPAASAAVPGPGALLTAGLGGAGSTPQAAPAVGSPGAQPAALTMADLSKQITSLLAGQDGTYGYYLLDLNTGNSISYNADEPYLAASTFKLPMALYVLQQVEQGQARFDEALTLQESDWEDGTGVLLDAEPGSTYTLGELLDLAIKESDNVATNMLLRRFGGHEVIWEYERLLGGSFTHDEEGNNLTTPTDLARYMQVALQPKVLSDAARARLLDDLTHTAFPVRIAAGVPAGIPVAHKIGTLENVVNDIGYVQLPGYPYILAICSGDVTEETGDEILAEVSGLIYQYYAAQS